MREDVGENRRELWTWLDTRDAARAVLAVLTSGLTGHHVLLHGSHFDTTLARTLLGFEPEHRWRSVSTGEPAA